MMHGGNLMRSGGYAMRGAGHGFMVNGSIGWWGLIPLACHLIFMSILVILAVVIRRRHAAKVRMIQKQNDPALLLLRERYAQGEIDTEEFNRRKEDLSPSSAAVKR